MTTMAEQAKLLTTQQVDRDFECIVVNLTEKFPSLEARNLLISGADAFFGHHLAHAALQSQIPTTCSVRRTVFDSYCGDLMGNQSAFVRQS
jgi:hypothetical protein